MEKVKIVTEYTVFPNSDDLSESQRNLLQRAHQNLERSYSPYSKFKVGAALLLANGVIIDGANQENASYPMCTCAETTVLTGANVNHPGISIEMIAITVQGSKEIPLPVSPCGKCRQQLLECEGKQKENIQIILQGSSGPIYMISSAKDLLPLSFDGSVL